MPILPILLIGGAAVLAVIAAAQAFQTHERHQTLGWTFDELVGDVVRGYDHNRDGFVSLQAREGWFRLDERTRTSRREFQMSPTSRKTITIDTYSQYPLLARADQLGNNDRMVSQAELTRVVATYDINGDGRLQVAEHDAFLRDFGESRIQHYTTYVDPPRSRAQQQGPKASNGQEQGNKQS